jgi:hypothetical protein
LECVVEWKGTAQYQRTGSRLTAFVALQMPSPIKLEDLATDLPISASSKAKAKQAVQSRVFQVPPVCIQFRITFPRILDFRLSSQMAVLLMLLFSFYFRSRRVWLMFSASSTIWALVRENPTAIMKFETLKLIGMYKRRQIRQLPRSAQHAHLLLQNKSEHKRVLRNGFQNCLSLR